MYKKIIITLLFSIMLFACIGKACGKAELSSCKKVSAATNDKVNAVLERLRAKQQELVTFEAQIEYRFTQLLLESETVRKGVLYYKKNEADPNRSKLRISFETLKQDDANEQPYVEHFIFDGVWLNRIDFQVKSIEVRQMTEEDRPVNAFELANKYFPIIGFGGSHELSTEFEIKFVEPTGKKSAGKLDHLSLKVKPDSTYKDNYTTIDFYIDKKESLPVRILTHSTQEDIYDFLISQIKVNKNLENSVFDVETGADFSKNTIPLKK